MVRPLSPDQWPHATDEERAAGWRDPKFDRRFKTPDRRKRSQSVAAAPHVPTPDELDDLLSGISAAGYAASEARDIVENWTRKWGGVESAFTTKWNEETPR